MQWPGPRGLGGAVGAAAEKGRGELELVLRRRFNPRLDFLGDADGHGRAKPNVLRVTLVQARGLAAMDTNLLSASASDPMVTFASSAGLSKQSTVKKQTLEPCWHESFRLPADFDESGLLTCAMEDWDLFSGNDFMGHVLIDAQPLADKRRVRGWYALQRKADVTTRAARTRSRARAGCRRRAQPPRRARPRRSRRRRSARSSSCCAPRTTRASTSSPAPTTTARCLRTSCASRSSARAACPRWTLAAAATRSRSSRSARTRARARSSRSRARRGGARSSRCRRARWRPPTARACASCSTTGTRCRRPTRSARRRRARAAAQPAARARVAQALARVGSAETGRRGARRARARAAVGAQPRARARRAWSPRGRPRPERASARALPRRRR